MPETIVLIGATAGVGLATAQAFAREGYRVVISGRSPQTVDAAVAKIGDGATGYPLDFAAPEAAGRFFEQVGPLDHLALVGSGQAAWGPFADLRLDTLKTAFEQKFFGFFLCVQASLARLRPDGSITFLTGGASRSAIPETSGVAAVNGAIQAMAITLAKELAPRRVNVLSPGLVDTPVYDYMTSEQKSAFFAKMGGALPVGRIGRPEEIAQGVLFLVRSAYTTGAILDVDGGGRLH